jgi:hypothetical protein
MEDCWGRSSRPAQPGVDAEKPVRRPSINLCIFVTGKEDDAKLCASVLPSATQGLHRTSLGRALVESARRSGSERARR